MRARTVNENISFQRGRSPKEALGVGLSSLKISDSDRMFLIGVYGNQSVEDARDIIIRMLDKLQGIEDPDKKESYRKKTYATIAYFMDMHGESLESELLGESVNFQRGQDPRKSMDIGLSNDEVKKRILQDEFPGLDINFKDYYGVLIATVFYPDEGYPEESDEEFMEVNYYWDEDENEWTPDV